MLGLEGKKFAGYEVLKMLGQGGMGVVYKAHDINLDRPIALKILSDHLAQNPAFHRAVSARGPRLPRNWIIPISSACSAPANPKAPTTLPWNSWSG